MRKTIGIFLKILPFIIVAILIISMLLSGRQPSVEGVLSYMPDNLFVAALLLLLMYALKSLSVIFPLIILQIAAGMIFPVWIALILNTLGTALSYTIPYLIGRFSGTDATNRIIKKYPKAREIVDMQRNATWFPSFFLRAVSCLPGDIVSLCLGSVGVSYLPYVVASVVGTLPGLIPATIAGMSIMNPKSAVFITSVVITVASSIASIVVYGILKRKNKPKRV